MEIRRFREEDAKEVSEVIRTTVRISNTKDYSAELMDELITTGRQSRRTVLPYRQRR